MIAAPTIRFDVFMAGDLARAKQVCREYCFNVGLCVTVEPVEFIYTGGAESGIRVGLINYPRFPTTEDALHEQACRLATFLMCELYQRIAIQLPARAKPNGSPAVQMHHQFPQSIASD